MSVQYVINGEQVLEENIPEHLYPFANSPGNHDFCISLAEADYGQIYIFAQDGRSPQQTYVASSFEAFVEGLQIDESE